MIPRLHIQVRYSGPRRPPDFDSALRRAMQRSVAVVFRKTAGLLEGPLVQRRTGRLLGALSAKVTQRPGYVTGLVKIDPKKAFYAAFLERGAQPHELGLGARMARRPSRRHRRGERARAAFIGRRASVMRFTVGGQTLFRYRARHPGIRGRHFMLIGLDQSRAEVQRIFREEAARAVARAS